MPVTREGFVEFPSRCGHTLHDCRSRGESYGFLGRTWQRVDDRMRDRLRRGRVGGE